MKRYLLPAAMLGISAALAFGARAQEAAPEESAQAQTLPLAVGTYPQVVATSHTQAQGLPSNDITAVGLDDAGTVFVLTAEGPARLEDGAWTAVPEEEHDAVIEIVQPKDSVVVGDGRTLHDIADNPEGGFAAGSAGGLFTGERGADFLLLQPKTVTDSVGRIWGAGDVRGVAYDAHGELWFCSPAGIVRQQGENWVFYEGKDGVPYKDFTCAAAGPDGAVWFGTTMGAIRWNGADFEYYEGPRYLPDNHVRDIAVDDGGNAWVATSEGLGFIEMRPMTLAEKAAFYEEEMELIKRTPFGYVSEVNLPAPGDRTPETIIYTDSDNDGLWTAMYGAGQCFAYGATGDPVFKERADQAFEALRFLQTVTQGGSHPAPPGFVARTILPTDGPDPNEGRMERDARRQEEGDKLWKVYEPRWPISEDGEWYWKSDTSSDELDGHYFFFPLYYDLVAETEEEKEAAREVIRGITDHLIEHGYNFVDHTGTVTRWGVYSPEGLNADPDWWIERGLKSLSMLSYLVAAHHMTGDDKYLEHYNTLVHEHHFAFNAMNSKVSLGVASSNQSDDEMGFMMFYNLIKYMPRDEHFNMLRYAFYSRYIQEEPERNPFFNFCYAAFGQDATYTNPWGEHDIRIWPTWLEESVDTLQRLPLDRVNWPHRNSHRADIAFLTRHTAVDPPEQMPDPPQRGYRVTTGQVIPYENQHFNHWNTDPWRLDYGGNGQQLASGTVFLLPYYMGLYHGFIQ